MAHATCIAVSFGTSYTVSHTPPCSTQHHVYSHTRPRAPRLPCPTPSASGPSPRSRCLPSRLWQQSRILFLALARVPGASRELPLSPRQNPPSREPASPEYYRFVYSAIDSCTRLLRPKCCAAAPPNAVSKVSPARPCPFPLRRDNQYVFRLQSSNNPQTSPLSTFSVNVLPVPLSPVGTS
jgi:hypothetical protein